MEILKKINLIIVFIIILFIVYNCNKTENKTQAPNTYPIEILNILYKENSIYVKCLIKNNTNVKLYFPIDNQTVKCLNNEYKKLNVNAFYGLVFNGDSIKYAKYYISFNNQGLKKYNDSIKKLNIKQYNSPINNENSIFWNIKYYKIKKNSFYIHPFSSDTIVIKFDLDINLDKIAVVYDLSGYDKNDLKNSKLQIAIRIDSTEAKNLLLPKDLDSLRKNNIKIFHGIIYSNKVPLNMK